MFSWGFKAWEILKIRDSDLQERRLHRDTFYSFMSYECMKISMVWNSANHVRSNFAGANI